MAMPIERKNSFHLLLSDDELKLLRLQAESEGLNASDFLRLLIRQGKSPSAQQLATALQVQRIMAADLDLGEMYAATREAGPGKKKR